MYFTQKIENLDYTEFIQHLILLYFNHDYENICKILKLEYNNNYNKKNDITYKYQNTGMMFLESENSITLQRIYVDKETKYILDTLLMVTSNSMNEKTFIDLIIDNWLKNVHITGILESNYIPEIVGKETYIQLKVGEKCWKDLTKSCKNKGILIKTGFKMSLLNYLNEISYNFS